MFQCIIIEHDCRLQCPLSAAVVLASYAVQCKLSIFPKKQKINKFKITVLVIIHNQHLPQCLAAEMGDHSSSHQPGYVSKGHFIPEQDEDFLSKVEDLHPQHK